MTVVYAQILLYLFGAHQSASSQIAMDTENSTYYFGVLHLVSSRVIPGMVAALTNE